MDIGRVAAECLLEPAAGIRIVELAHAPDHTPEDIAAALSELLGRTVTLQPAPLDAVVPALTGMGFSKPTAELIREMHSALMRAACGTRVRRRSGASASWAPPTCCAACSPRARRTPEAGPARLPAS